MIATSHEAKTQLSKLTAPVEAGDDRILNNEGPLVYSMVSLWEIGRKTSKRGYHDLALPFDWDQRIARGFEQEKVEAIEIRPRHGKMAEELPQHHHDSFDRMIFAQAIERDFALVSSDRNAPFIWMR